MSKIIENTDVMHALHALNDIARLRAWQLAKFVYSVFALLIFLHVIFIIFIR